MHFLRVRVRSPRWVSTPFFLSSLARKMGIYTAILDSRLKDKWILTFSCRKRNNALWNFERVLTPRSESLVNFRHGWWFLNFWILNKFPQHAYLRPTCRFEAYLIFIQAVCWKGAKISQQVFKNIWFFANFRVTLVSSLMFPFVGEFHKKHREFRKQSHKYWLWVGEVFFPNQTGFMHYR